MIKLPAPRLLPVTIVAIAALLGLKSISLGERALASDPPSSTPGSQLTSAEHVSQSNAQPIGPDITARASASTAAIAAPAPEPSDWPLLQDLRARRQALDEREHALNLRDAALQAAAGTLQVRLAKLQSLQTKLEALQTARQQRSDTSWVGIVKVYEAMRPADAGAIFDALEPHLLVQILDRMNERKAALVLGNMEPERARLATQMLANYRQHFDADPAATSAPVSFSRPAGAG